MTFIDEGKRFESAASRLIQPPLYQRLDDVCDSHLQEGGLIWKAPGPVKDDITEKLKNDQGFPMYRDEFNLFYPLFPQSTEHYATDLPSLVPSFGADGTFQRFSDVLKMEQSIKTFSEIYQGAGKYDVHWVL